MPADEVNAKSERKPLRNVTNNYDRRSFKSVNVKTVSHKQKEETAMEEKEDEDVLDRILLVQSDISSILHQIDELVAQAFRLKTTSNEGRKEIESFSHVLSDALSSLKPWASRFQRALSATSEESECQPQQVLAKKPVSNEVREKSKVCDSPEPKLDFLVSPSPLVSWRANCTIERGRQMFMLTPLPISKALSNKRQEPFKSEFNRLSSSTNAFGTSTIFALSGDVPDCSFDAVVVKPTPLKPSASVAIQEANAQESASNSSLLFPKRESSMLVMTPCLKMSPPKSCVLLEPISEICDPGKDNVKVRKSTPFPVGFHYSDSESSESSGSDATKGMELKYLELLGIQHISKSGAGKKTVEASPDWFMSPPKTCVLLEPPDEKAFGLEKADKGLQMRDTVTINKEAKEDNVIEDHNQTKQSCSKEHFDGNLSPTESTMWLEPASSFRAGKCPGENTLKKEFWTKFEAASIKGLLNKTPTVRNATQKGFLDLLEEASCED